MGQYLHVRAKAEGNMVMTTNTYTSKELAERLNTEPKRLRRFFRSPESPVQPVGKGKRYRIEARQFRTLKKSFTTWSNTHTRSAA